MKRSSSGFGAITTAAFWKLLWITVAIKNKEEELLKLKEEGGFSTPGGNNVKLLDYSALLPSPP